MFRGVRKEPPTGIGFRLPVLANSIYILLKIVTIALCTLIVEIAPAVLEGLGCLLVIGTHPEFLDGH